MAAAMEAGDGGMLVGLDVDPENLKYARKRIEAMGLTKVELRTFHANFGEAQDVLVELRVKRFDGLLADFGVSTNQLLDARHGLSFNADRPLDMRLDPRIRVKADSYGVVVRVRTLSWTVAVLVMTVAAPPTSLAFTVIV